MPGLPEWGAAFLRQRRQAVLATTDTDGSPHAVPVWYVFHDGRLCVGTQSASRKARNAAARPIATLTVDSREPGNERWVSGTGPVSVIRGEEARQIVAMVHERYLTAEARSDSRIGPVLAGVDDVVLAIAPSTWRSWAAAEMDAQFFGGILGASRTRWFRALD